MEAVRAISMDVDQGNETPAIRALGSLFKLTEVFLWDDALMDTAEVSYSHVRHGSSAEPTISRTRDVVSMNIDNETHDNTPSIGDMELARQMSALGLPVSFITNKERKTGVTKRKGKGTPIIKDHSVCNDNEDVQLQVSDVSEVEVASSVIFSGSTSSYLCDTPTVSQSEMSYCDVAVGSRCGDLIGLTSASLSEVAQERTPKEIYGELSTSGMDYETVRGSIMSDCSTDVAVLPVNLDNSASLEDISQNVSSGIGNKELDKGLIECNNLEGSFMAFYDREGGKLCVDIRTGKAWDLDSGVSPQASDMLDHIDLNNCTCHGDPAEWMACWDSFYTRNYFYNTKTQESTWYPPPGMEHLAFSDITSMSCEAVADATEREGISSLYSDDMKVLDPCSLQDKTACFEEARDEDKLSGHPHHEVSSDIDLAACGFVPGLESSAICSCEQVDELDDEKVSFCPSSHSQEHVDSLGNQFNQIGSEEVSKSDIFNKYVMVTSCMDAQKICDDMTFHSCEADSSSLITSVTKTVSKVQSSHMSFTTDELNSVHDSIASKKKKKVRRSRSQRDILSDDYEELLFHSVSIEQPADILKYWCQRYFLFSRFDEGIKMDKEGWFSVTPETIAQHHASRCGSGVIVDCFTGVGGNAIQFAKRSDHVIAVDIDPQKIEYAQHNAAIYGVNDRIDFIQGDYFHLAPTLKADIVFLSPPWGGPDYAKVHTYDIKTMLKPCDGYLLFSTARRIASRIVMFLPRNVDLNQLAELSLSVNPPWALEVEKNFLNAQSPSISKRKDLQPVWQSGLNVDGWIPGGGGFRRFHPISAIISPEIRKKKPEEEKQGKEMQPCATSLQWENAIAARTEILPSTISNPSFSIISTNFILSSSTSFITVVVVNSMFPFVTSHTPLPNPPSIPALASKILLPPLAHHPLLYQSKVIASQL
ncbi:hypothetical protein NE237_022838 [Protea cynaroides]|uniref:Trimethylguanosine synthase n=1 Tax=Protea cynaroides TaxID=273540 RepID=A0A9Q0K3W7_9MAGN|nr:hypothetical protein NE237_022838 [Protea cynaroides]